MRLAFRTAWPPAIAVLGVLPVLLAPRRHRAGRPGRERRRAGRPLLVAVLFGCVCGWVRVRDEIGAWFREQMEQANGQDLTRGPAVLEADGASKAYADLVALEPARPRGSRPGRRWRSSATTAPASPPSCAWPPGCSS